MKRDYHVPYIGVTGFTKVEDVRKASTFYRYEALLHDDSRLFMIGVVVTYKSLRGIPMKEKWAKQTPSPENISSLFLPGNRTLNLVHFSTEKESIPAEVLTDMRRAISLGGEHCHGIQINMDWPSVSMLEGLKESSGYPRVVLQISRAAAAMMGDDPKKILNEIEKYVGLIDDVLFDPSGGEGTSLDPKRARVLLVEGYMRGYDLGYGVAGGLGPHSLDLVDKLITEFPKMSIDSQGKQRNESNELDPERVKKYLERSLGMYNDEWHPVPLEDPR
jgi:hypothetical protein